MSGTDKIVNEFINVFEKMTSAEQEKCMEKIGALYTSKAVDKPAATKRLHAAKPYANKQPPYSILALQCTNRPLAENDFILFKDRSLTDK